MSHLTRRSVANSTLVAPLVVLLALALTLPATAAP